MQWMPVGLKCTFVICFTLLFSYRLFEQIHFLNATLRCKTVTRLFAK